MLLNLVYCLYSVYLTLKSKFLVLSLKIHLTLHVKYGLHIQVLTSMLHVFILLIFIHLLCHVNWFWFQDFSRSWGVRMNVVLSPKSLQESPSWAKLKNLTDSMHIPKEFHYEINLNNLQLVLKFVETNLSFILVTCEIWYFDTNL